MDLVRRRFQMVVHVKVMRCFYILALILASAAADKPEDETSVICERGKAETKKISGTKDRKWQFMRTNCSADVLLYINVTKVVLCNRDSSAEHAILVTEGKPTSSESGKATFIESERNQTFDLSKYQQVDLYATINSSRKKSNCNFIVKFKYSFTYHGATSTTRQPIRITPTPTKTTTTTTPIATARATYSIGTHRNAAGETSTTNGERGDEGYSVEIPTNDPQSSCTVATILAILFGSLFGLALALVYVTYRRGQRNPRDQQGQVASKTGATSNVESSEDAETRVNEVYNLE